MRIVLAIAVAAMVLFPMRSGADTTAKLANVLAIEQTADVILTDAAMRGRQCFTTIDPAYPVSRTYCGPIFVEEDPLAKPFVHSLPASLAAAAVVNVGVRLTAEKNHTMRYALGAAVLLYPLLLEHNARVLRASLQVKF